MAERPETPDTMEHNCTLIEKLNRTKILSKGIDAPKWVDVAFVTPIIAHLNSSFKELTAFIGQCNYSDNKITHCFQGSISGGNYIKII